MTIFQALTWEARDTEDGKQHLISIFGRTADGKSVCVSTEFKPYFFIKLLPNHEPKKLFKKISDKCSHTDPETGEITYFITGYTLTESKDLWGFQNNETFSFMRLNFATLKDMRQTDYRLRNKLAGETATLRMYEANIEPVLRLMHRTGIQSTGWLDTGDDCTPNFIAKTDLDLFQSDWTRLKPVNRDDIAPFIIASFDIETNSSTGKFPNPQEEGDCVFQIAITLKKQGGPVYERVCFCYKETAPLEEAEIRWYPSEREMLEAFQVYMVKKDIDVITGWNIYGFDLDYIYKRAVMTKCSQFFFELSKFKNHHCEMLYKTLSSSALGDNALKLLPMPGRFVFDLFHQVKREHNLDSYSLNAVSKKFLGDQKIDMSPKEMFRRCEVFSGLRPREPLLTQSLRRFREEDPKELSEVAEYCVKDTLLPHALMEKLYTFLNLIEMAKATWVRTSTGWGPRHFAQSVFSRRSRYATSLTGVSRSKSSLS
jgi:DNA polymerase delta subunit 1